MARDNFAACLAHVLQHEGGYVDHPSDPGGATNMGITHKTLAAWRGRPVTKADVRELTRQEAAAIYRTWYWWPVRGDDLPAGLDLVAFDAAVNSGVSRGAKWLQRAVGAQEDGAVGAVTLAAAQRAYAPDAIQRAIAARMAFLRALKTWSTFGKGWTSRVEGVRLTALAMADGAVPDPKPEPQSGIGKVLAFLGAAVAAGAAYLWHQIFGG